MSSDERIDEFDAEAINDRLAVDHPINEYYARAPLPIRLVEQRRLAVIRHFMGDTDRLDVLEVGCGGGHVLGMFPSARLTGIDISEVQLNVARRNLAGYEVQFIKGEVDKLGLSAASFDRVICTEVLEHVVDPDVVLEAIAKILRPSGFAILTVPNDPLILRVKGLIRRTPARRVFGNRIEWGGDRYHLHQWSPVEFEALAGQHMHVVKRRMVPFSAMPLRACFLCVRR